MELIWLGTGGGRLATILQPVGTGGLIIKTSTNQIHVDPGPGAIVRAWQYGVNPKLTNMVLITHDHTDHTAGYLPIIEAMSGEARRKRGILIASKSCVEGYGENFPKIVNPYVRKLVGEIYEILPGEEIIKNGIKIEGTKTIHEDKYGVGFEIEAEGKKIVILGDTQYFSGIEEYVNGKDIAIFNVLKPGNQRYPMHMSTRDVIKILNHSKPKLAIIQHFGMKMLRVGPEKEAKRIKEETNVKTIAAKDGMVIKL